LRITITKYDFSGNEDKNINFFTGISTVGSSIDLYDYLEKDGMSNINYEFEGVDSENSIYVKCSNVTLTCKSDIYNGTNLTDYFELYLQNKYIKFKANFYDEDDVLFYSGIIQTDGIEISDLRDDLLSITVLGYEKEFKEGFSNVSLLDASSLNYDMPPGTPLNIRDLYFYTAERLIKYNFGNILDDTTATFLRDIFISKNPYTYADNSRFEDYSTNTFHIKTGYKSFWLDAIDRFAWFDSLCLSMGWVWFFHLGKLVVQERRDNDFPIKHIDYNELIIRNGLTNRVEQFQCSNVAITSGEYADSGNTSNRLFGYNYNALTRYSLAGTQTTMYSNVNDYDNRQRPFAYLTYHAGILGIAYYDLNPALHHIARQETEDNYSYILSSYYVIPFTEPDVTRFKFDKKKTITINPYICSKKNAGGINIANARNNTAPRYYGNGNFYNYTEIDSELNQYEGLYTGHAGHSVVTYNSVTGKLQTYEFYSQSENFKANFKKFVKVNEDVILEIEVAELITNPLQRIHIDNFPYYDIDSKDFIIESLSFNYFDKTTILKIRMI
jgi:hypothetical protein